MWPYAGQVGLFIADADDFAHHPTAVAEKLAGLRASNPDARIWAVFEPRSASSCRRIFQDDFARAFAGANEVLIAPIFRSKLPETERLSVPQLVRDLGKQGIPAREAEAIADIGAGIAKGHRTGDLAGLMCNGGARRPHGRPCALPGPRRRRMARRLGPNGPAT